MSAVSVTRWRVVGVAALGLLILTVIVLYQESAVKQNLSNSAVTIIESFNSVGGGGSKSGGSASQGAGQPLKRINGGIAHYSEHFYQKLRPLVKRKAEARDPELIQLIKEIIDAPSKNSLTKFSYQIVKTPQAGEVLNVLNGTVKNGFYIECGALDGERSSNTVYLEKQLGWSGLLVEMDPHYYTQILGKARQSWSINACLSPHPYVTELQFKASNGGMGKVEVNQEATATSASSAPCFPLEAILLAIGQNHVHYFSLDVEGVELDILKTIPFDRLTIDTFSVEYRHGDSNSEMLNFMKEKNYKMHKNIVYENPAISLFVKDFIFVRNNLK